MNQFVNIVPRRRVQPVVEEVQIEPSSSSEEEVDLAYIIREKPDVKVVREYFRYKVSGIEDD